MYNNCNELMIMKNMSKIALKNYKAELRSVPPEQKF